MGFGRTLGTLALGIGLAILPANANTGVYKTRHNTYDTGNPITAPRCDKEIGCKEAKLIDALHGIDTSYSCGEGLLEQSGDVIMDFTPMRISSAAKLYNQDFNNLQSDLRTYNILIQQAERKGDTAEAHSLVWDAERAILDHTFKYCFIYSDCIEFDTVIVRACRVDSKQKTDSTNQQR